MKMFPPFVHGLALAAIASWGLHYFGCLPGPFESDRASIFGTLAQVAGTMLGFMLAALAVVASITDTDLLRRMRETGHYDALLQNLFANSLLFLGCAILSLLMLLGVHLSNWWFAVLFGLHVAAAIMLFVVGWQFWLTLRNVNPRAEDIKDKTMPNIDS
jgi:predicted lysophospholipase L1 biosynthesis ABC-type transport system permease subunit